jgi:L-threonylcarbamoyladenylate synthase
MQQAAQMLRQGQLVAFPTETVYGLGADGLKAQAVKDIYRAKGRPSDNPLILHIADIPEIERLVRRVPANAQALMTKYWPGPLTVVLERKSIVPDATTGGLDTVAVRLPSSPVARELIRLAGVPIAAPSANTSGRPSPTTAAAVKADLDGKIAAIIDAGPCAIGLESTVVDCTTDIPTLLRPGGITLEMLEATLGAVEVDPTLNGSTTTAPRAPGMKYRHYAPAAPLILVENASSAATEAILKREITAALAQSQRVGAVVSAETAAVLPATVVKAVYGARADRLAVANNLYQCLRQFDYTPVDIIYAEGLDESGLGLAVMNRLRKSAGYQIIRR